MLNAIRAEFYKLGKLNGFKIILLLNAFIYVGMAFLIIFTADIAPEDLPEGVTITTSNATILGYDAYYSSITQSSIIFIATFIGLFVCNDFSNRTLGLAVSSGKARINMLVGKTVPVMFGTFFILITCPIAMTSILTAYNGFGVEITTSLLVEMLVYFILYILINLSITSVCVLIAYIVKNMGATISICIGVVLMYSSISTMQLGETWQNIMSLTPFYYAGNMSTVVTNADIIKVICICVATFVIAGGFSYITLQKTELK